MREKLSKVFKLSSGKSLTAKNRIEGEFNVYGGNGITGNHNDYFVSESTVVIGRVGEYCGAAHLTTNKCWVTDNALMVTKWLVPVNKEYIVYVLKALNINRFAKTVGQPSISQGTIYDLEIDLLSLEEQEEIVEKLNTSLQLIKKQNEQLGEYDNLIKSRFVEMFGNPIRNTLDWDEKTLLEVCTKLNDGTHHSPENLSEGEFKYITAKNIKRTGLNLSNISYVSREDHKCIFSRCNPEFGDVLYIKDGATTGIAAINPLDEEFSLLSSVALLKHDRKLINGEYLCNVLNSDEMYENIRRNMGGAAITRLTITKLKAIVIPVPPLNLQNEFSEFINQVDKLKVEVQKSLNETQVLFDSLMQKYFE